MPTIAIHSLDDPRLEPYRALKQTNLTRRTHSFVAEGHLLLERLLASRITTLSVLTARRLADRLSPAIPDHVPLLVLPNDQLAQLVGFNFHRGVLAHAQRPENPMLASLFPSTTSPRTIVVCPNVHDPENLGSLFRSSSVLGIDAMLLGPTCADPYSRRVLRVSMGASLRLPWRESDDLAADINWLVAEHQFQFVAAVADPHAEPCRNFQRAHCTALMFGNEAHGLDHQWIAHCARQITIPMVPGVDSLNVAVAAGVLLYELSPLGRSAHKKGAS